MGYRVGIPRALAYYYVYPFMKGFLEALGAEVVLSPASGPHTLDDMRYCPTDEPCVSVKLLFAHAKAVLDRGVDFLFLPVLSSLEPDNYCCPKLIGCPAMIKEGLDLPEDMILAPEINEKEKPGAWRQSFVACAQRLGAAKRQALQALERGLELQKQFEAITRQAKITTVEAFRRLEGRSEARARRFDRAAEFDPNQQIGVMGHPYLLYDLVGQNTVERLREYGQVITFEMVPLEVVNQELATVFEGHKMWTYEARILGASYYLLRHHLVDKLILVGAFECGPESVLEAFIEREAERQGVPFLLLTLDEHTGEAGVVTRLEAFVDTTVGQAAAAATAAEPLSAEAASAPTVGSPGVDAIPAGTLAGAAIPSDNLPGVAIPGSATSGAAPSGSAASVGAFPGDGRPIPNNAPSMGCPAIHHLDQLDHGDQPEPGLDRAGSPVFIPGPRPSHQEMVIGTPSMGYLDIALRAVFQECGVKAVRTPPMTQRSVELGKEIAPEFMCYPLVTTVGQMREALEKGANLILMVGGKGRCRLGWYAQVQQILLRRLGYQFDLAIIDSPVPLKTNWKPFKETVRWVTGRAPLKKILAGLYLGYHKMEALDAGEAWVREARAYERKIGSADRVFKRFLAKMDKAASVKEVKRLRQGLAEELDSLEREDTNPLRVRLVGEIYCLLEPFVNQDIERLLASREAPRVLVDRELTATSWFDQHILGRRSLKRRHEEVIRAAAPYLNTPVGGHGQESIGLTVLAKRDGVDGVIHLLPFTCMPEIVAQNVLVKLSEEIDLPVLSLVISEQTGEAGFVTRLEAFLEVLEERRYASRGGEKGALLFGY